MGTAAGTHGILLLGLTCLFIQIQLEEMQGVAAWTFSVDPEHAIGPYGHPIEDPSRDDFLLVVKTHVPKEAGLSCSAKKAGSDLGFFHYFALRSGEARRHFFQADPKQYFHVSCYYAYDGNYMADIVLFDSRWPDVDDCRWKNGGCRYLISSDFVLYKLTRRGKFMIGDLAQKRCKYLWFVPYRCDEIHHTRPLAGRVTTRLDWLTHRG